MAETNSPKDYPFRTKNINPVIHTFALKILGIPEGTSRENCSLLFVLMLAMDSMFIIINKWLELTDSGPK